jgi:hypothetical protein
MLFTVTCNVLPVGDVELRNADAVIPFHEGERPASQDV